MERWNNLNNCLDNKFPYELKSIIFYKFNALETPSCLAIKSLIKSIDTKKNIKKEKISIIIPNREVCYSCLASPYKPEKHKPIVYKLYDEDRCWWRCKICTECFNKINFTKFKKKLYK